jgi:hypothetical protein
MSPTLAGVIAATALLFSSCTLVGVPNGLPGQSRVPQLSFLDPRCSLRAQYVGFGSTREILIMRCGNAEFVVRDPNNFVGHVRITTTQEALEYLRFFSSPETYGLFELGGMVEIVPSKNPEGFNEIDPATFNRYFKESSVKVYDTKCRWSGDLECPRCFTVERPVVFLDERVLELTQEVCENGYTHTVGNVLVLQNAESIGILHFGDL